MQTRVAIIHPDLGLGGAERLIVDFAVELREAKFDVELYTAHHDPSRCFEDTLQPNGNRADWVHVHGDWLPRHICGRLHVVFAYLRCIYLALCVLCSWNSYHVIILDQVSAPIPLLRCLGRARVIFYCHFPDMLLASRASLLRSLYRAPIDALEQFSTGCAHEVLVNSKFTAGVFASTFTGLSHIQPQVLYPAVDVSRFSSVPPPPCQPFQVSRQTESIFETLSSSGINQIPSESVVLLSINRFERKKGLSLALTSFALLPQLNRARTFLVLAGGFDPRVAENVEHLKELQVLAEVLGLTDRVVFVPSFTDSQRHALLTACTAIIYTPQEEHFGIVPLEGMAAARPVVACNSGGPLETVVHGETGFICEPQSESFASAITRLVAEEGLANRMGLAARKHVQAKFSRQEMGKELCAIVNNSSKIK